MDENEFEPLMQSRPFGTREAVEADRQYRRLLTLAEALWGRTAEDLQRQLLAQHPEIPPGFDLSDLRISHAKAEQVRAGSTDPRNAWLSRPPLFSQIIVAGGEPLTALEARCEIARRAIEFLEKH